MQARQTISKALAAAIEISDANSRAGILAKISGVQAEVGDVGQARHTFAKALAATNELNDAWRRAGALVDIAPNACGSSKPRTPQ